MGEIGRRVLFLNNCMRIYNYLKIKIRSLIKKLINLPHTLIPSLILPRTLHARYCSRCQAWVSEHRRKKIPAPASLRPLLK